MDIIETLVKSYHLLSSSSPASEVTVMVKLVGSSESTANIVNKHYMRYEWGTTVGTTANSTYLNRSEFIS